MELEIRDCTLEDIPKVVAIEKMSFDDPYPLHLFKSFLQSFPKGFRIAMVRGDVVGYVIILPLKDIGIFVLASIAVHPQFKKMRIAASLLEDAIAIARRNKASKILLQVAVENDPAIRLYSKFGFSQAGTIRNYYGRDRDAIEMEYVLH